MIRIPRLLLASLTIISLSVGIAATSVSSASAATKTCSVSTPISQRPTLRRGDTGTCVTVAQGLLTNVGTFHSTYTKNFGADTEAAVIQAQRNANINDDGIIGPVTWGVLAKSSPATKQAVATNTKTTVNNSITKHCDNTHYRTICVIKGGNGSAGKLYMIENGKVKKTLTIRTSDSRNHSSDPFKVTSEGKLKVVKKSTGNDYALFYDDYDNSTNNSNGQQAIRYSAIFAKCGYDGNLSGNKCVIDYRGATFGGVDISSQSDAKDLYLWSNKGTEIVILSQTNARK